MDTREPKLSCWRLLPVEGSYHGTIRLGRGTINNSICIGLLADSGLVGCFKLVAPPCRYKTWLVSACRLPETVSNRRLSYCMRESYRLSIPNILNMEFTNLCTWMLSAHWRCCFNLVVVSKERWRAQVEISATSWQKRTHSFGGNATELPFHNTSDVISKLNLCLAKTEKTEKVIIAPCPVVWWCVYIK